MHGGLGVALPIAIPLGIIGVEVKTLIYVLVVGPFAGVFDRLAAAGKQRKYTGLHFGLWTLQWFLYSLIPFFAILFGSTATQNVINMIPASIINGLSVAGNLLPAVGMAMLMKILWENNISVYYFLGFLIVAYFKVPLIAVAVMAIVIGVVSAQNDYRMHKIEKKADERPVAAASSTGQANIETTDELENDDFFS